MWAQLIKVRLQPTRTCRAGRADASDRATRFGPVADDSHTGPEGPGRFHVLVVFESEENARAREWDPRRAEGLQASQAMTANLLASPGSSSIWLPGKVDR